jgi:hypothetical protein
LVERPQGRRPLGRPGLRWEDNSYYCIKTMLDIVHCLRYIFIHDVSGVGRTPVFR